MKELLIQHIDTALKGLGISSAAIHLEHPAELVHGDYSTSVALAVAKAEKANPRELAEKIVNALLKQKMSEVERIEIAGPGFINFRLSPSYVRSKISELRNGVALNAAPQGGEKIIFEYTQPNPFKEFHIGHMMNNMIGEAVSRLLEANGNEVKRATYHGDVGLHVAKTIWGVMKLGLGKFSIKDLGKAYATGNTAYEDDAAAKEEIISINKKIYDKSDASINKLYDEGRALSLEYFEELYKKLGSTFDPGFHFFESEAAPIGKAIVEKNTPGIFEKSEGAVVFKGENYGLHTRVFITKEGIATYEAKEIGLAEMKTKKFPADKMITVTANEQNAFFTVVTKAIELVFPKYKDRIVHLSTGMLKLPSGKMSSRTGTVIPAEILISEVEEKVREKIKDRGYDEATSAELVPKVALAALRYSILRQAIGGDIIFDFEKSVSFEGDSGPYLLYSTVRAKSVLEKANSLRLDVGGLRGEKDLDVGGLSNLERLLLRLPEVVVRAGQEYSPHLLVTYLVELSGEFNAYYAHNQIVNEKDPAGSAYKVILTQAFVNVMNKGLELLGIDVPRKM